MIKLKRPLVFFDLETTGIDHATDRIVQFAAKVMSTWGDAWCCTQTLDMLIDPGIPIPAEASDVHGITEADVVGAPRFEDVAEKLYSLMSGCDWAGHNILRFDVPVLLRQFEECGYRLNPLPKFVDTFRIFLEDKPHTLVGAYKHYVHPGGFSDAHNALADVEATFAVFAAQVEQEREFALKDVDEIHAHYRVPGQVDIAGKLAWDGDDVVFTFGKHKGVPVMNVPEDYLRWCKKEGVLAVDAWDIIRKLYRGENLKGVF
jgi:DNA polymerase-3 subunit epsilon